MPATDSQLDSPHRSASTGLPVFTPYDSLPSGWTPSQGGRVTMEDVDGLKRNIVSLHFNTLQHQSNVQGTRFGKSRRTGARKCVNELCAAKIVSPVLSRFLLSTNTSCNTDQYFHAPFLAASASHYRDYNLSCSYQRIG